jgi:hypothetical protein
MGRAVDYPLRDTALGTDYTYSFTISADYKQTWDNVIADLGLVQLVGGLVPPELLPDGGTGGSGNGDVVGPASVTADRVALWNGTSGNLLKEGTVGQLVPTAGAANGYFLGFAGGVPTWQANNLTIPDGSITYTKLVPIAPATVLGRNAVDGSGEPIELTASVLLDMLGVEPGAAADQSGEEMITLEAAAAAADDDLAAAWAHAILAAIATYVANDPGNAQTDLTAAGLVWTSGTINANQAVIGAVDGSTGVQAADMTNGTPTVAGIVAGSTGMIATSEIMASVWAPRLATLVTGALTFDASTGLQFTVAAGANNIVVAESCWTNIPLDKSVILEIVAGASARTITFTNTSVNLVVDSTSSPWNVTSTGTRVRFELSWVAEGAAPTVKSKRLAVFLGYYA